MPKYLVIVSRFTRKNLFGNILPKIMLSFIFEL